MSIVDRIKNICLSPTTEWPVIAEESTPTSDLLTGYVAPLAGVAAIAGFVGSSIVGTTMPFVGTYRLPFMAGIGAAVFQFVMAFVGIFIISILIDLLAPTFGGQKNSAQAMKVAVYSYTPGWLAGALQFLPMTSILTIIGGLYGIYLLYLGLPRLMKSPEDKAIGYTAVVVVCAIVVSVVVASVGGLFLGAGMMGAGALGGAMSGGADSSEVEFDEDSPMGRLQELGRRMEESAERMEEAEESGDPEAQMGAAMEALGSLLGGGSRVEPVSIETLSGFVPETLGGLSQTSRNVERVGMAGIMATKAEVTYGDGQREIRLEMTDTGGISGIMGLASWMGAEGEKEDDTMSERTRRVDGRLTHEKVSKTGGPNEFGLVVGDRFAVHTTGRGVDLNGLRTAVSSLNLSGLEALKDSGVEEQ